MPDETLPFAPVAGDMLTSAGMNANLYGTTAGTSILETGNGHLDFLNFDPAFKIQGYQVRPGQAGRAVSVGRVPSNDYFSDLWTGDGVGYIPIAGACVTFYTEYDLSLAMFFASGFCSVWRQFGPDNGVWPSRAAAPDISVRTFFADPHGNITTHAHSQRDMPQTVFLNAGAAAGEGRISTVEQRLTRHYNLSHPKMAGETTPCGPILAGEHTFGMAVLVKKNLSGQDTSKADEAWRLSLNNAAFNPDARPSTNYAGIHRVRFYTRLSSAVLLL